MKIHPSKTGTVSGIPGRGLGLLPRPAKVVWGFHPGAIHGFPYANWFSQYITGRGRGASLTNADACLSLGAFTAL